MNEVSIIIKDKNLSNFQKSMAFRKIAYKAWELKDYKRAIEFIEHAKDFSEYEQNTQVLDWDLIRIYAEMKI